MVVHAFKLSSWGAEGQRQADLCESEGSLVYRVNFRDPEPHGETSNLADEK